MLTDREEKALNQFIFTYLFIEKIIFQGADI